MDAAAARLARAVTQHETVGVFGDYDVDGAASSALMVRFLRGLGCRVEFHVPDRTTEGYGPNAPALRALVRRGVTLIVCVDCGTAAADALAAVHRHRRRGRAGPPQIGRAAAAGAGDGQSQPARRCLRPGDAVRRRRGVPDRRRDAARAAAAGGLQVARRAGPARSAGSRGAGDRVRRDAAARLQPRVGLPGAESDGAPRAAGLGRAAGRGAGARPAQRDDLRLRAGSADQCRRAHRRG